MATDPIDARRLDAKRSSAGSCHSRRRRLTIPPLIAGSGPSLSMSQLGLARSPLRQEPVGSIDEDRTITTRARHSRIRRRCVRQRVRGRVTLRNDRQRRNPPRRGLGEDVPATSCHYGRVRQERKSGCCISFRTGNEPAFTHLGALRIARAGGSRVVSADLIDIASCSRITQSSSVL